MNSECPRSQNGKAIVEEELPQTGAKEARLPTAGYQTSVKSDWTEVRVVLKENMKEQWRITPTCEDAIISWQGFGGKE